MIPVVFVRAPWHEGENQSTRYSTNLASWEVSSLSVHTGFHLFRHEQDAKDFAKAYTNRSVYECTIKPEDIVAVGTWAWSLTFETHSQDYPRESECIVATKARLGNRLI
jgi:hypothetical protein